jgi:ATP-dependent DNA helicase RecG
MRLCARRIIRRMSAGCCRRIKRGERLAYDELLANQLTIALVRSRQKKSSGRALKGTGALRKKMLPALPFELTGAQKRAIAEIDKDMAEASRMMRLLQGDVGSGKQWSRQWR